MILKPLFLMLLSVFLAKCGADSDCSTIITSGIYSRSSLGLFGKQIYKCFATNTIDNGRKVMINVREELLAMHQKSPKMLDLKGDIDDFLLKYKAWKQSKILEKRFQLMNVALDAIVRLCNKYDATLLLSPTEEDISITQLLVRNSLDVFDQIYMEDFENLSTQITMATESYLNMFPPNESDLINWFERFQNAPTAQESWVVFTTFFEIFVMRLGFESGDLHSPPTSFRVVSSNDSK